MQKSALPAFLHHKFSYKANGSLWIECEGERFFGPGRVELLQRIDETGSINKAARMMSMSYKKAWEMINALNSQASRPMVITQTGGDKGGGSRITEDARHLIRYHQQMRQRFEAFLENETRELAAM